MSPAYPLSTIDSKSKGGQKLAVEGRNPLHLDMKEPTGNFHDFLMGEVRYSSLVQTFPDEAKKLHTQLEKEYKERYEGYKEMAEG
jgi:pyruvate-ferredoxin/flavodoxin oxidoreductase